LAHDADGVVDGRAGQAMSQEWLKKLAELSNDKELARRAQELQQRAKAERRRDQPSGGARRSLFGAAFGYFFRFLFLIALVQAAAMFIVAEMDGLGNESWGLIFHHTVWYPLKQPVFPAEVYDLLRDWIGLTQSDLGAFYAYVNEDIEKHQDLLVYAVPAGAALALTLFFLPAINAGRRRSPIRVFVYLANLAVIALAGELGEGVMVIWLAALVFSFVGGGSTRVRKASPPERPSAPQRPARPQPAAVPAAAVARAGRPAVVERRDPTVVRRAGGSSWIRGR
jgi:hypothetical protein